MSLNYRKKLGEILVENGELSQDQLHYAIEKRKTVTERFGEICVSDGLTTEEAVARALAQQFELEFIDLQGFKVDEAILSAFPPDVIYRHHFVPLQQDEEARDRDDAQQGQEVRQVDHGQHGGSATLGSCFRSCPATFGGTSAVTVTIPSR